MKPKELTIAEIAKHHSIRSLAKLTNTRVEYGFSFCYFDGATVPTEYRHGKEFLIKRGFQKGIKFNESSS